MFISVFVFSGSGAQAPAVVICSFMSLCASLSRESWESQVEHNSDDELYDECSTLSHLVIGILHFVMCPHVLSLDF